MATQTKPVAAKTAQAAPKPAEAAPKAAEAAPKPADLDFSTLTLETAPVSELKRQRQTILDRSPVLNWLRESYDSQEAKTVTVPADQADGLERLLRSGVDRLTAETKVRIGVAVTQTKLDDGRVRVAFFAKDRRKYTERKRKSAEATA